MTHDHQHSFAVILSEADGEERFRTTVMASDREQAVEKAEQLAERIEVELVEPAGNLPVARVTLPGVEKEEDAASGPELDQAGSALEG